jgi:type IV pilus assembly protein PilC
LLAIALPLGAWRYLHTPAGREWFDNFKIKAPLFGKILRNLYLARISESLATLVRSDISILDAIKITAELVGNHNYQMILLDAEENVRGGGVISESLAKYEEIPPLMSSMVAIGERTGKLEYMLGHVSKFYRSEAEQSIATISQLIEPILVLVLGVGVALLVASVLLPIYGLVNAA